MVLKFGNFVNQIRNNRKALKYRAGEG